MPDWNDFLAVFILFWPAVVTTSFLGFLCFVGFIFFIGSALLIFFVFLYGVYSLLRDTGSLDWLLTKLFVTKKYMTETVGFNVRKSFLFELHSTLPKGPALYTGHPHGLYALSWFIHFSLGLTEWPSSSPRPIMAVHSIFFHIPLVRELFERHGCIEATEDAIVNTLQKGNSVILLVGGIEELYYTNSESIRLVLKKRNGFVRIAKKAGVPIVPLITLGENELFPVSESFIWKSIQSFLYKTFHIALPLPQWKSLWSWITLMYTPLKKPLQTFILPPIEDTSQTSLEDIKEQYLRAIDEFRVSREINIEIIA